MSSMTTPAEFEVRRLVEAGVLIKRMNYRVNPSPGVLLSFCNRLEGRMMHAEVSFDSMRKQAEAFEMVVTEVVDGQEAEVVSVYRHDSLAHLIKTGSGFLCLYSTGKQAKKPGKAVMTIRVDENLREAFEAAAAATGESQAVVIRQLMRYFAGKGPDPKQAG